MLTPSIIRAPVLCQLSGQYDENSILSCRSPRSLKRQRLCRNNSVDTSNTNGLTENNIYLELVFPVEIWNRILAFVEGEELLSLSKTARFLRTYISSPSCDILWKKRCKERFFCRIVAKRGEQEKNLWYKSYCAAKADTVHAAPLYATDEEFAIDTRQGGYALIHFSVFTNGNHKVPWGDQATRAIENAIAEDEEYLGNATACENIKYGKIKQGCCIFSFQGYKFAYINRTTFELNEDSTYSFAPVPITSSCHEPHTRPSSICQGILLAPVSFLAEHFGSHPFIARRNSLHWRYIKENSEVGCISKYIWNDKDSDVRDHVPMPVNVVRVRDISTTRSNILWLTNTTWCLSI